MIIVLNEDSIREIQWRIDNIKNKNGKWIRFPKKWHVLETDASNASWGANLRGIHTSGRWSQVDSLLHIDVLELIAIKFDLLSLCYKIDKAHICIRSDNSSAVRYIYNQGGSVMSLFKDYERHFLWCDEKSLWYQQFTQRGKKYYCRLFVKGIKWFNRMEIKWTSFSENL